MNSARANAYYTASILEDSNYPQLIDDIDVDVAVIGGGFTGVNCALELAECGLQVALVEANKIAWGASGRNGGQITGSLSGDQAMVKAMRKRLGHEVENFVWNLRWRGHDIIKKRVAQYQIQCDLKHGHLHTAYKPTHINVLRQSYQQAVERGFDKHLQLLEREEIANYLETDLYHGAIYNRKNMHVHPLNLCLGEAKAASALGTLIFENTAVTQILHGSSPVVITPKGHINAKRVLLAGNAYHRLGTTKLQGKIFPAAGGIVATEQLSEGVASAINPKDLAVYDSRFVLDYYRLTADRRLLFGGGANYSGRPSRNIAAELRPGLEKTFPRLKGVAIDYAWSGMMGIVVNRIPQLGQLSDHVYYAQGYSGHGIATSHIVAEIMAKALQGHMEEFDTFAGCPQIKVPGSQWLGNQLLALGMWYYRLLEALR